jgi:hypothetical protein
MRYRSCWRLCLMALVITGCTRFCKPSHEDMTPDQVVEAYLETALNMSDVRQRDDLMEYTTGNLKAAIANSSDETIKAAYIDRKYKLLSYSVIERRDRTPREAEITFRMVFKDPQTGEGGSGKMEDAAQVTTENTVALSKEKKVWLVKDVIGARATIDFPVTEEARIRAAAPAKTGQ